ncbi:putative transcription factor C2H2 family [Dioscorea sansibarensis]
MAASERKRREPRYQSIFDLPAGFFDSSRLLRPLEIPSSISLCPPSAPRPPSPPHGDEATAEDCVHEAFGVEGRGKETTTLWTCNTCKQGFDSLQDQRSHFKSDLHRLNVKLSFSGKNIIEEEDFDELGGDASFEDFDISSISDSEDESEKGLSNKSNEEIKQRLFLHLQSGDTISIWRCLLMDETVHLSLDNSKSSQFGDAGSLPCMDEVGLISRLKALLCEPRNKTHLRIVLLVSGGHFAGCVFDGNSIIAHKTFHRYVVRAKAGKKQSSKDATGKAAHSAGSALRRYNEAALKKDIHELLVSWKQYIQSASCIFIYAPSKNRQLLFDDERPQLNFHEHVVRHVPLTVHRPTLKEVKRIYNQLTQMAYEVNWDTGVEESQMNMAADQNDNLQSDKAYLDKQLKVKETASELSSGAEASDLNLPSDGRNLSFSPLENELTPLHEAARSGNAQQTLQLLEQGLNPCIKDPRGRTPYLLATDKEVRNTFRRFMALNLDNWDWHAANVPSPLTKEMEETQAAKQTEKDAKRKAKAKELKKLRKAKEKAKAQAEAENILKVSSLSQETTAPPTPARSQTKPNIKPFISKEEEQKRALAEAREKRAAAAERRIAALNTQPVSTVPTPISSPAASSASDIKCSCCNVSLAGKVPFHRYHYKYCSTSCMHVHREMLEDE